MKACKYVIYDDSNFAIFSEGKGHREFTKSGRITSAGILMFYINESGEIDLVTCGGSVSLDIPSRPEDTEIIRLMMGIE